MCLKQKKAKMEEKKMKSFLDCRFSRKTRCSRQANVQLSRILKVIKDVKVRMASWFSDYPACHGDSWNHQGLYLKRQVDVNGILMIVQDAKVIIRIIHNVTVILRIIQDVNGILMIVQDAKVIIRIIRNVKLFLRIIHDVNVILMIVQDVKGIFMIL